MSGVTLIHPSKEVGNLHLRLPPTSVEWTFKLNTAITDTFGGQVIQILSSSYDSLVVTGRFGAEGPHGMNLVYADGHAIRKEERTPEGYFDLGTRNKPRRGFHNKQRLEIGLTQLTAYFRRYFSVATAGGDHISPGGSFVRGAYNQQYMRLSYTGNIEDWERHWLVYPTSFPSYRRTNQDFAPEWRMEFQVVQPDFFIDTKNRLAAIDRLKKQVGYRPLNPFSDPLAQEYVTKSGKRILTKITKDQLDELNTSVFDYYGSMLQTLSPSDLQEILNVEASLPNIYEKNIQKLLGQSENEKKKKRKRQRKRRNQNQ